MYISIDISTHLFGAKLDETKEINISRLEHYFTYTLQSTQYL